MGLLRFPLILMNLVHGKGRMPKLLPSYSALLNLIWLVNNRRGFTTAKAMWDYLRRIYYQDNSA
jgi:hypothetical protein